MIPIEIIGFLRQLSAGQLEIVYENLTCKLEYPTMPLPPVLGSKDDIILLICTVPCVDVLNELLHHNFVQEHYLYSELENLYKRYSNIEVQHQTLEGLLRTSHTYAERISLFIEHSKSIGWTEETFERLMGVYAHYTVGFVIDTDQESGENSITVRTSEPVDLQYINAFSKLVFAKYPQQFQQEYCQHAYNSSHYEHPLLTLFEGYLPLIRDEKSEWNDTLDKLCHPNLLKRDDGIEQLRKLMTNTPSLCRYLSQLFEISSPNTLIQYPLFEHSLLSRNSILSALWIFSYLQIDLPKNLNNDRALTTKEYLKLITPLREMFIPLIVEAKEFMERKEVV